METESKREKNVGGFRYPHPQWPTPCLSFMSVPFPYHPHSVVCIIGFVFSLFFFPPFLSSSSLAFKIMKLCCGPCPLFSSSCSPWWCVGEVGRGDPQIYISPTALSLLLYYLETKQQQQKMASWISIALPDKLVEVFFFFLYCVLKFNGLMCLVYIKRKPLPSASAHSCSV